MSSDLFIHSNAQFRRYEGAIKIILEAYPKPTRFHRDTQKGDTSAITFAARLRDAINGMRLNGWTSQYFQLEDLERVFSLLKKGGDFVITTQGGAVYVGPRMKDNGEIKVDHQTQVQVEPGQVDARDHEVVKALYLLKVRGLLEGPIEFVNMSPELHELALTHELEVISPNEKLTVII